MRHQLQLTGKSVLALVLLGLSPAAWSQTAQITGRVSDPTDASVPGATITIRNTETGIQRDAESNSEGYFVAPLLTRGAYEIRVQQTGFKPVVRSKITLDEGQVLRLDFRLELGNVQEAVEVTAAAPVLEKETSSISTVINRDKILQLPVLNRNITQLTALVPTVVPLGGKNFNALPVSSANQGSMSIGGGPSTSNNYQVDGIAAANVATGNTNMYLSLDAVEEFRVITRNPSAEYGRTGGGVVLMISKSGTNEFHGSMYEYFRNTVLNANDFFSNRAGKSRADTKLNQWGATFGGPLIKQKTFFFFNYEGFQLRSAANVTRTVPTTDQREGNFQGTLDATGRQVLIYDPLTTSLRGGSYARDPFPNNAIPSSQISPVARAILKYLPSGNQAGIAGTGANNFYGQGSTPQNKRIYGIKVDHNFNNQQRISARYTHDNSTYPYGPKYYGLPAEPLQDENSLPRDSAVVTYTNVLTPRLLLEVRAGLNKYGIDSVSPSEGFSIASLGLPANLEAQMQRKLFPTINISDITTFGGPNPSPFRQGNYASTAGGSLTQIFGRHTMKYGTEWNLFRLNNTQRTDAPLTLSFNRGFTQGVSPNTTGTNIGSGMASFLLGWTGSGTGSINATSTYSIKTQALFVQDDWKLTRKLTLNLGLRWEHEGPYTDRFNAMTNFDPSKQFTANGIALVGGLSFPGDKGFDRGVRETSWRDFQPRFGFAYQLDANTVLRGGYGLYFLPTTGNNITMGRSGFDQNTGVVATNASTQGGFYPVAPLSNPFPNGLIPALGAGGGETAGIGTGISATGRWLQRGNSQQFNFNVQRQLPGQFMLEVGYAANRGAGMQANRAFHYLPFSVAKQYTAAQLQSAVSNPYCSLVQPGLICNPTVQLSSLLNTYPQFNSVSVLDNWGDSIYHALTVTGQRRVAPGLTMLLSYTFSKLLDNNEGGVTLGGSNGVQDWEHINLERGISALNLPQRAVATVLYDLPFGKRGARLYRALAGGWQVNGILTLQSGSPIGVTTAAGGKLFAGSRPNLVGDPRPADPTIDRWLNAAAFVVADERSPGNAPRNLTNIQTDGLQNLDVSVLKSFFLTERVHAQFRAEASNVTNTPTFGSPGTGFGSSTFGVVTSTVSDPRNMQLALKLVF
ncbi:TonB-dependent receptor [uncultured Paludibaculum sp.]|uniref:TonB-dependent receptor n=1 Tax=uncultured Paludibaculum sp. TaxID=1765020 RepID=UPI002AABE5C0|nr:TonB-dependent receptor [uncultured Paludibaculum sp.]